MKSTSSTRSRSDRPRWAPRERYEHPGLTAAIEQLGTSKTPPPAGYRPAPRTFPGKRVQPIDGQLDLFGNEHRKHGDGER